MSSNNCTDTTVDEQHLFKALIECSPMLVAYLDPQFNFIQVNQAYAEADEKEPPYFPGKNHFDLYPNKENLQIFQNVVKTGKPFQAQAKPFEYENNRERGVSYWDWSLVPVRGESGQVTALLLSLTDVTERKRAEEELRESEEKYRMLFKTMEQGVVYQNASGEIVSANPAAARILGMTLDQMQGRTSIDPRWKTVHEDGSDFPGETHPSMVALKTGKVVIDVIMGVFNPETKTDHWILVNAVPQFRAGEDSPAQVYTTFTDITERKRAEERIEFLSQVTEQVTDSIITTDLNFKITYVNRAFQKLYGYSSKDVIGESPGFLNVSMNAEDIQSAIYEAASNGREWRGEIQNRRKDGSVFPCELTVYPIKDENGQVIAYAGNQRDITERRRAEVALAQSEERFKKLFQLAPLGYQSLDENGDYLEVNDAWCRTLGYSRDEVIGHNFGEFIDPGFRDIYQRCFPKFKNEGLLEGVELTLIKKDGARIIASFVGRVGFNEDGSFKQTHCIFVDITERKRAEEELKVSERRFSALVEAAPIAIYETDAQGKCLYVNEKWRKLAGMTLEDALGDGWQNGLHKEDRARLFQLWKEHAQHNKPWDTEYRFCTPDGKVSLVMGKATALRDADGRVTGYLGANVDITERKQAEDGLRESEEKFRDLVETSQDLIWACDAEGKFTYLNQAWEKTLGYTVEEMLGRPFSDFQRPEVFERDIKEFARHMAGGFVKGYETSHVSKAGADVHLVFNAIPLFDSEKNIIGTQGTAYDITDRKLVEEELRASEERFRGIIENTDVGYFFIDQDGKFRDVNSAWVRMHKYASADEIIGEHFTVIQKADDVEKAKEFVVGIMAGDTRFLGGEFSRKCKDSSIGYHTFSARPVSRVGEVVGLEGFIIDTTERKVAEDALRESEELSRAVIDHSPVGISVRSRAGQLLTYNQAWCDIWQISDEDLDDYQNRGRHELKFDERDNYLGEWKPKVKKIYEDGGYLFIPELEIKKSRKGHHLWISQHFYAVKDSEGNVDSVVVLTNDITERKRADRTLIERDYILRESQRVAALGSYDLDIVGGVWTSSEVLNAVFGIDGDYRKDMEGWAQIIHPEDREGMVAYFAEEVIGKGSPFDRQYRIIRHNDEETRWVHGGGKLEFDDEGNPVRMIGTIQDVTDRKRAEDALRESEKKFRTYISNAPDAVFIADPQGRYMDVNEAACRLTGYSKKELTNMSIADLTDPKQLDEAQARFESFIETGSLSTESRFRRKDGSIVSVSLDAVVLSEGLFMAFCSDITETKRLRELESRAQRLETAGQIAGQVAHDFNNLLAPLVAYPEFIRDELGADHPALPYLDDIENASRQIADINQQLLTLGRRGHYNQEVMNLNEVVLQATRQMEAPPSTLVIETRLEKELMNIRGGKSQIFRAVSNILVNAREAMQDIGQITVRTENFYVDEMWINYARVPQGEYVKLTITDTGCGIPEEIKQRIFEPFFTTKTADKKRGSGLGISVVDAVIKDHEGHIDVTSNMGEGTSFFIYFPVTRDSIDSPSHHEIVGGRESILIVDDDKVQRDVCAKLLNSLGYRTTAIGSGEEALKVLADQKYDLLILDMIMPPGIDGAETFRQTLLIEPDQKAIIVSGFAESDRVAAALKMGAGAFVKKPLTRSRLATAVRDELDRVTSSA